MSKFLEYFEGTFDASVAEKIKPENKPYVAYSRTEGVVYTVVPKPVTGPADNEIWYTSSDGGVVAPYSTGAFGANIVSNTYENGKGVITFDNPVTSIGKWAFLDRSSLTSIAIPNSVTSIGNEAFNCCSSLISITIPNSVTIIGDYSFYGCTSLTSITIGNSVTLIDAYAFYGCSDLTSITFEGTMEEWNSITKGVDWNTNTPATYVQCSDGDVTIA